MGRKVKQLKNYTTEQVKALYESDEKHRTGVKLYAILQLTRGLDISVILTPLSGILTPLGQLFQRTKNLTKLQFFLKLSNSNNFFLTHTFALKLNFV